MSNFSWSAYALDTAPKNGPQQVRLQDTPIKILGVPTAPAEAYLTTELLRPARVPVTTTISTMATVTTSLTTTTTTSTTTIPITPMINLPSPTITQIVPEVGIWATRLFAMCAAVFLSISVYYFLQGLFATAIGAMGPAATSILAFLFARMARS